jgi:nucleotide-binding universal stress UspA family protein
MNNAFFDFIHITNDQHHFERLKDKLYQRLVTKRDLLCGFNIKCLEGDDGKVHEKISRYANEVRAGMIVLVTHQRKFLEALRHESVTKKALHHPELPILIIHQAKD